VRNSISGVSVNWWLAYWSYIGGALGWKKRGDLDPAFEAVAFELEASTTSNPKYTEVKTGFGYHIVMVEGRK
jgi:peptidyl-prolyl cis-trans isomerase NIMA-interacting 4